MAYFNEHRVDDSSLQRCISVTSILISFSHAG